MKEDAEVITLPAVRERSAVSLQPVKSLAAAKASMREFQEFIAEYLEESTDGGASGDYGVIQGTKKKTLLKSGADKLCELYGMYDEYEIISHVEDFDRGLFDYTLKCVLKSRRDDSIIGTGLGSCSSWESRYRYRDSQRKCPSCGKETIIKGKEEYGGGWLCWGKKGGCGTKYADGDQSIEGQTIGRTENPDIIDTKNTVLKIAKKRAKIDATIGATRSSGILTQDLDELPPIDVKPEKPPVARTTEETPVRRPAAQAQPDKEPEKVITMFQASIKQVAEQKKIKTTDSDYVKYTGCITLGQQTNFRRMWHDAAADSGLNQTDLELLRHDWLYKNGYKDDDGNPTSAKIPAKDFMRVRDAAEAFARGLNDLHESGDDTQARYEVE